MSPTLGECEPDAAFSRANVAAMTSGSGTAGTAERTRAGGSPMQPWAVERQWLVPGDRQGLQRQAQGGIGGAPWARCRPRPVILPARGEGFFALPRRPRDPDGPAAPNTRAP